MSFSSMMKSKPLTRKVLQSNTDKFDRLETANLKSLQQYHDDDAISPTSSTASHHVPASHNPLQQGRRSSFYSQPSILLPLKFTNPWNGPESPQRISSARTTERKTPIVNSTETQSVDTQAQEGQSYGHNRQQHTAVSEYIAARSWTQEILPQPPLSPSSRPLYLLWDNITGTIRRKSSLFTSGVGRNDSLPIHQDHQFHRRTSSVCFTHSTIADSQPERSVEISSPSDSASQVGTTRTQCDHSTTFSKTLFCPASEQSSVFSSRDQSWGPMHGISRYGSQTPSSRTSNSTATTTIPIPSHTPHGAQLPQRALTQKQQQPQHPTKPVDTRAALLRGLNQTYSSYSGASSNSKLQQRSNPSYQLFKPSLWSTGPIRPPTSGIYRPPPPRPGAKIMPSRTKDAQRCCDQGKFLGVGTMRAISPAGVDMLQGWMMNSLRKTKGMEKGVKEIRKWLRDQDRNTVEWVAEWLYYRWGCEL